MLLKVSKTVDVMVAMKVYSQVASMAAWSGDMMVEMMVAWTVCQSVEKSVAVLATSWDLKSVHNWVVRSDWSLVGWMAGWLVDLRVV